MSLDPTALLAELAAIRGDVKTACMVAILDAPGPIADGLLSIGDRLDALMYAIAAPPPADNGMLGTVNQRLNALERRMNEHHERLESLEEDRRYRDLRRAQDDAHEAHDAG